MVEFWRTNTIKHHHQPSTFNHCHPFWSASSGAKILAIRGGTNHHKGLVHPDVWHDQGQKGHKNEPCRSKPLHDTSHLRLSQLVLSNLSANLVKDRKLKAGESGWTCWNGAQFGIFYMDLDLHNKQEDHTLDCRVEQLSHGKILHMGWEAVT